MPKFWLPIQYYNIVVIVDFLEILKFSSFYQVSEHYFLFLRIKKTNLNRLVINYIWYRRWDLNPHDQGHEILSLTCLPIPSLRHTIYIILLLFLINQNILLLIFHYNIFQFHKNQDILTLTYHLHLDNKYHLQI